MRNVSDMVPHAPIVTTGDDTSYIMLHLGANKLCLYVYKSRVLVVGRGTTFNMPVVEPHTQVQVDNFRTQTCSQRFPKQLAIASIEPECLESLKHFKNSTAKRSSRMSRVFTRSTSCETDHPETSCQNTHENSRNSESSTLTPPSNFNKQETCQQHNPTPY